MLICFGVIDYALVDLTRVCRINDARLRRRPLPQPTGVSRILTPCLDSKVWNACSHSVTGKVSVISAAVLTVPAASSRRALSHDEGTLALLPVTTSSLDRKSVG